MTSYLRQLDVAPLSGAAGGAARVARLAWGFVALGTVVRLLVYLLRFPLWVDECMLAENYLDRSSFDLLSPLDHHQVAPIGFLWIELAAVKLLGFSEWSLRLFPLVCGIGSLFVFRHVASRLLAGIPFVLAVACLAVAKAPIGLSADAKPYATDLFVAVTLLALAVEWFCRPERTIWLWCLALFVPLALALSLPAVFVAGAVSIGLAAPVWRRRCLRSRAAFAAFNLALGLAFAGLYYASIGAQAAAQKEFMVAYWSQFEAFPPWNPVRLAAWLVSVHLGDKILAVPYGAENGGGLPALVCLACAAVAMYRNGQRPVLAIGLATCGLTFLAAICHLYPYAGHARLSQFLAPVLALGCGLGAALLLAALRDVRLRNRLTTALLVGLALFGVGIAGRAVQHPFHHPYDVRQRDTARDVWQGDSEFVTICALADLRATFWSDGWYPYYRCNQRIYSARHHRGAAFESCSLLPANRGVRLVVYRPTCKTIDRRLLADCLDRFAPQFESKGHTELTLSAPDLSPENSDAYEIYELRPRPKTVLVGASAN